MFLTVTQPPFWLILPFISLLLMIAIGPVLMSHFWHRNYARISVIIGISVAAYYVFVLHEVWLPLETLAEYISFISLLTVLFVASGGVYLFVDVESKPITNILFLFIAAVLTNVLGTTGASVLLIRPFMRINRYRLKPYHVVFFIFIVSNLGGLLTPIGDPPLFMGFLKGVPFQWTISHLWPHWLVANTVLLGVFYYFEKQNTELDEVDSSTHYTNKIIVTGKRNFIWLTLGIASVFIDPNVIDGLPSLMIHGKKVSYIREILQLSIAYLCYRNANRHAMQSNEFSFEPIKEVAYLFIGIFLSMVPALQILEHSMQSSQGNIHLTPSLIYFGSGIFSSVLDNAPTYMNVLAVIMSSLGLSVNNVSHIQQLIRSEDVVLLAAVSAGSVFFGAMTYIGNGPNFMVKAIAEHAGVRMPSFGAYIGRYSIPILLPVLLLIWLLFF
jgi:Na+/H+ antiporter NhaD/arsenite permease-like protein